MSGISGIFFWKRRRKIVEEYGRLLCGIGRVHWNGVWSVIKSPAESLSLSLIANQTCLGMVVVATKFPPRETNNTSLMVNISKFDWFHPRKKILYIFIFYSQDMIVANRQNLQVLFRLIIREKMHNWNDEGMFSFRKSWRFAISNFARCKWRRQEEKCNYTFRIAYEVYYYYCYYYHLVEEKQEKENGF